MCLCLSRCPGEVRAHVRFSPRAPARLFYKRWKIGVALRGLGITLQTCRFNFILTYNYMSVSMLLTNNNNHIEERAEGR